MLAGLKKLIGRQPAAPAYIETRLDHLRSASFMPPPPPPLPLAAAPLPAPPAAAQPGAEPYAPLEEGEWVPSPDPSVLPDIAVPPLGASRPDASPGPSVRVVLADGTETSLAADPALADRAEYLVRNMLPPKPPQPRDPS